MIELSDSLYTAIFNEAERLKAEGVDPEAAWLRAITSEYHRAQIGKGAATFERAVWDRQMGGKAN